MDLSKRAASDFASEPKLVSHTSLHQTTDSKQKRKLFILLSETKMPPLRQPFNPTESAAANPELSLGKIEFFFFFAKLGLKQGKTEEPNSHLLPSPSRDLGEQKGMLIVSFALSVSLSSRAMD